MQREAVGLWAWPWERISAFAGIAAVVLWVIGALLIFPGEPGQAAGEEIVSYFQENTVRVIAGAWIFATGVLLFLWFLTALRARLLAVEGPLGRAGTLAFATGIAVAIFAVALPSTRATGAFQSGDISAGGAEALWAVEGAFFGGAELMGVVFLLATGVAILLTRALPTWWGWVTIVLGVWLFILPIGWLGLLLGFPTWVAVTSVLLALRPGATVAVEQTAPPPERAV